MQASLYSNRSCPFEPPETGKIAGGLGAATLGRPYGGAAPGRGDSALRAESDEAGWASLYANRSYAFDAPETGRR